MFFDSFPGVADNIFALISGYCSSCNEKSNLSKIISIWLQAFFYSFGFILLYKIFQLGNYNFKEIIKSMMPVTFSDCWYLTCYIALLFLMPFIDKMLNSMKEQEMKRLAIVILIIFSVYNFFFDSFNIRYGLSILWLSLLYALGNIIKRLGVFKNVKTSRLIIITTMCIIFTSLISEAFDMAQFKRPICPTQLISSICMLIIFSRIKFQHTFSKGFSSKIFAIYLFHDMGHTLNLISSFLKNILNSNILNNTLIFFLSTILIMVFAYIIETLREALLNKLKINNLINLVCDSIYKFSNLIIEKL